MRLERPGKVYFYWSIERISVTRSVYRREAWAFSIRLKRL